MTVKIFWLLIDLLEKPDLSSVQCKRLRVIYIYLELRNEEPKETKNAERMNERREERTKESKTKRDSPKLIKGVSDFKLRFDLRRSLESL